MFRRAKAQTETLYRQGVARWQIRDLTGAVASLQAALAASPGPDSDGWWFSVSRALAQVAIEQDDLETAAGHLMPLPGTGVGNAQQSALRARLLWLRGDHRSAEALVSMAVGFLSDDQDADVGNLMNGAIALMWCGEVLAELGYGNEASRLTGMARTRIDTAAVHDPVLDSGLALVEASAARLVGDTDTALGLLEAIDTSASPEFGIQVKCEAARHAWIGGDQDTARALYAEAAAEAQARSYPAMGRTIRAESVSGPPAARNAESPLEDWGREHLEELAAEQRPYAVVARLVVEGSLAPYSELEQRVSRRLQEAPELGYVDTAGTDGHVWELFLEGEDPDALWEAVASLVIPLAAVGSRVVIRRGEQVQTLPLP